MDTNTIKWLQGVFGDSNWRVMCGFDRPTLDYLSDKVETLLKPLSDNGAAVTVITNGYVVEGETPSTAPRYEPVLPEDPQQRVFLEARVQGVVLFCLTYDTAIDRCRLVTGLKVDGQKPWGYPIEVPLPDPGDDSGNYEGVKAVEHFKGVVLDRVLHYLKSREIRSRLWVILTLGV